MRNGRTFARTLVSITFSIICVIAGVPAKVANAADVWPQRPIRLVVSTTAGGSPDTIARMVGRAAEP